MSGGVSEEAQRSERDAAVAAHGRDEAPVPTSQQRSSAGGEHAAPEQRCAAAPCVAAKGKRCGRAHTRIDSPGARPGSSLPYGITTSPPAARASDRSGAGCGWCSLALGSGRGRRRVRAQGRCAADAAVRALNAEARAAAMRRRRGPACAPQLLGVRGEALAACATAQRALHGAARDAPIDGAAMDFMAGGRRRAACGLREAAIRGGRFVHDREKARLAGQGRSAPFLASALAHFADRAHSPTLPRLRRLARAAVKQRDTVRAASTPLRRRRMSARSRGQLGRLARRTRRCRDEPAAAASTARARGSAAWRSAIRRAPCPHSPALATDAALALASTQPLADMAAAALLLLLAAPAVVAQVDPQTRARPPPAPLLLAPRCLTRPRRCPPRL